MTLAPDALAPQTLAPQTLVAGALLFARMLPLGLLAAARTPWPVALAIPGALALGLLPSALPSAATLPVEPLALLALAPRELVLGALYAVWLLLPLAAFEWAGRLTGLALRAPSAERIVGALYGALAAAGFFALGGHRVALRTLAEHLGRTPLGQHGAYPDLGRAALGSIALASQALLVAVTLALPALAALAFAELAVGLVVRGSGSPLALSLLPLRPLLGLALLLVSLSIALQLLPELLGSALRTF